MKTEEAIIWAVDYLTKNGPAPVGSVEPVRTMPWSMVARIPTAKGFTYLKQMGAPFDREHVLLQQLAEWNKDGVWPLPQIPAINEELRCFLMKDAGIQLRVILKENYDISLVARVMTFCVSIQKASLSHVEDLIALGLPDWRLGNWPKLYSDLIEHTISQNLEAVLIQQLKERKDILVDLCQKLGGFNIPPALEHNDFNDSNVLIKDGTVTLNDWGDAVVTHPFFSLSTWLRSAGTNHGLTTDDTRYTAICDSYLGHWQDYAAPNELNAALDIARKLTPLRFAISYSRVSQCEGFEDYHEYKGLLSKSAGRFR